VGCFIGEEARCGGEASAKPDTEPEGALEKAASITHGNFLTCDVFLRQTVTRMTCTMTAKRRKRDELDAEWSGDKPRVSSRRRAIEVPPRSKMRRRAFADKDGNLRRIIAGRCMRSLEDSRRVTGGCRSLTDRWTRAVTALREGRAARADTLLLRGL
jgi:hypothetical protein